MTKILLTFFSIPSGSNMGVWSLFGLLSNIFITTKGHGNWPMSWWLGWAWARIGPLRLCSVNDTTIRLIWAEWFFFQNSQACTWTPPFPNWILTRCFQIYIWRTCHACNAPATPTNRAVILTDYKATKVLENSSTLWKRTATELVLKSPNHSDDILFFNHT